MAFNKDSNWNDLEGQERPRFTLESAMHQPAPGKKHKPAMLEQTMKQAPPHGGKRSFTLKSPNESMKQGKK